MIIVVDLQPEVQKLKLLGVASVQFNPCCTQLDYKLYLYGRFYFNTDQDLAMANQIH